MKLVCDLANNSFSGEVSQLASDANRSVRRITGQFLTTQELGFGHAARCGIADLVLLGHQHGLLAGELVLVQFVLAFVFADFIIDLRKQR